MRKILTKFIAFIDFILSKHNLSFLIIFKRFLIKFEAKIIFLIEDSDWAIKTVGKYITRNLKNLDLIYAEFDRRYFGKNKIIHFGSINCLKRDISSFNINKSNRHILTFFHISPSMNLENYIPYLNKKIDLLHTTNKTIKKKLIKLGFEDEKIIIIPLGVDLSIFRPFNQKSKIKLKKKFNLPEDKIIVGSFQKDGVGWGEGLEPKLIKGPDIFCEVIKKLKDKCDIHVFLTGLARGYVKKKLEEYQVPYTHVFLNNYGEMVKCYNVLDLYIISSRSEGGPLALLECMATGVPIITTKVGMAPEIIENGVNGFIVDVDDVENLYEYSIELLKNKELKNRIIKNNFKVIKDYSWENIAKQYYKNLYKRFLTR